MPSINSFVKSIRAALQGLLYVLNRERNFRIEVYCAIAIVILMYIFDMTVVERVILLIITTLVLIVELINTAVERVVDILKPRIHPYARIIKDIMAGTVLISSIGAVIVGGIIFFPYIYDLLCK